MILVIRTFCFTDWTALPEYSVSDLKAGDPRSEAEGMLEAESRRVEKTSARFWHHDSWRNARHGLDALGTSLSIGWRYCGIG